MISSIASILLKEQPRFLHQYIIFEIKEMLVISAI